MKQLQSPKARELRSFAIVVSLGFVTLFTLLPWLLKRAFHSWPLWLAAGLLLAGLTFPAALRPVYFLWMRIGAVLGWINTRIILSAVFMGIILPAGVLYRIFRRRDAAAFRGPDPSLETYRVPSSLRPRESMERPF